MIIPADKRDFQNKACCCNPDIILRNRITTSLKIKTNPGIACSNRFVNLHDKRISDKLVYKLFIVLAFCTVECTIQEFANNGDR